MRSPLVLVLVAALVTGTLYLRPATDEGVTASVAPPLGIQRATRLLNRQPGFFVPNLGQWDHPARFVHRSGPMTLLLEDRGWVVDLVERPAKKKTEPHAVYQAMPGDHDVEQTSRGVAVRMTFEGDGHLPIPKIAGEKKLPGHQNYFLGNDESCWRTDVPLYSAVHYDELYPGIDLRLREANGVPEYDLLLQPSADLSVVSVHVEGAKGLSIASDGSLVIETALGPLSQAVPRTWQVSSDGKKRDVVCNFTLLGADRFGFAAPGWDGGTSLTIDPGLVYSTLLGRSLSDEAHAISVDITGAVTVAGRTSSPDFPMTTGAYFATHGGGGDVFISRLDTGEIGSSQLAYSTFLGGRSEEYAMAISVDSSGVVTVSGKTNSVDFPVTKAAYDTTHNGRNDVFVSYLDLGKRGRQQLTYSTFVGGSGNDEVRSHVISATGRLTLVGATLSLNFPTTTGAYDTTYGGSGGTDGFVSRLDLAKSNSAQLVYSTFFGGNGNDYANAISVDNGVVTVAGGTTSADFPTTTGAYDTTHNGNYDSFVSRLDPGKTGTAQLVYSTFIGGSAVEYPCSLSVASGVVTTTGRTSSQDFPTTREAYDTTHNGSSDVFVSRLDPSKRGAEQLAYSTFLGGNASDYPCWLSVDTRGVVVVTGYTDSINFPATNGAYDTTHNGGDDAFISRLSMGVAFYADRYELSLKQAGTQNLWLDAGKSHANRSYAIFGSVTGTSPGITLSGIHIPLNVDLYTDITIGSALPPIYVGFKGTLDSKGEATASFNIPAGLPAYPKIKLYHAYLVFDGSGIYMASNAVPITLKN
jgi:hypothetical protein